MEVPGTASVNGYFGRPLAEADMARLDGRTVVHGDVMSMAAVDSLSNAMRGGEMTGDSLDDIVMQNQQEMERRRSMHPSAYARQQPPPHHRGSNMAADPRRTSMMDYEVAVSRASNEYPFQSVLGGPGQMMPPSAFTSIPDGMADNARRHVATGLALDTRFAGAIASYPGLPHSSTYPHGLHSAASLDLDNADPYASTGLSAQLAQSMSTAFSPTMLESRSHADATLVKHMSPGGLPQSMSDVRYGPPPTQPSFTGLVHSAQDPGGGMDVMDRGLEGGDPMDTMQAGGAPPPSAPPPGAPEAMDEMNHDLDEGDLFLHDRRSPPRPVRRTTFDSNMEPEGHTRGGLEVSGGPGRNDLGSDILRTIRLTLGRSTGNQELEEVSQAPAKDPALFQGVYSSSGFDMLKILMRVATRSNPEINIGAVDMSCAFVVCDVSQHDIPIVYCSEVFERLTGYTRHEILGRNCRFLQAPDGKVKSGVKRQYVDDQVVYRLKQKITDRREVQTSLINYRKGGQPFMNLLTMIPISWDTSEVRFYVGFQVDLVETPQSVTNKNPDGTYSINYQRGYLPRYVWHTPETPRHPTETGQTIPRDDVSTVLSTIGTGESELSKRIWDKVLLENTDDVVHVLSLKGLFLYLSPSSRKVLGYDSSELVGTALSSVCHPSDIVPVTRELKDTTAGAPVNVVFRIRRKHTGYTWFESHGSLHTEQGKGRKCIILVGRERPVYALSRTDVNAAGGIGDSELWSKMSTSGMFLFVSSNSKSLLDRPPDELVGTSIQALMRRDSKLEFGRQLELARTGKRARVKHEMQNRRGQVLQAHTTLYPGDAVEGQKPTFLVAQTRLIKMSRSIPARNHDMLQASPPTSGSTPSASTGHSGASPQPGPGQQLRRTNTNNPNQPSSLYQPTETVVTQPGGGGLPIGTQDDALAAEDNVFDELKTTRSTSWQFELRQMEKRNRLLAEELQSLLSAKKKRKRRRGAGQLQKDCANCHTRVTPEWRRGPSGNRDLCNSCGLRWAKQNGRVSPRTGSQQSDKQSASPQHSSPPIGETTTTGTMAPQTTTTTIPPGTMPPPKSRPGMRDGGNNANATRPSLASVTVSGPNQSTSTTKTTGASTLPRPSLKFEEDMGVT
ncbi:MAG: hypothetical protein M1823_005601 [Watsoniomyces obsoletus]|nr:MAG: hypothetical protein M1823_005601 [Watsoniomyces obsoletus]